MPYRLPPPSPSPSHRLVPGTNCSFIFCYQLTGMDLALALEQGIPEEDVGLGLQGPTR